MLVPRLGGIPDEAAIAAAAPRARLCLAEIDRLMADHMFLTGAHLSLADLMVLRSSTIFALSPMAAR
jgi:glutathione S-transferase